MPSKKAKPSAARGPAAPAPAQAGEIERIRSLARAMSEGDLSELEIEDTRSGLRVRLRRGGEPAPALQFLPSHAASAPLAPAAAPAAATSQPAAAAASGAKPASDAVPFTSPMVGTFYRSPSPEAEAFVELGARVGEDSTLCIIEAMKVMNEIKAEMSGTVVEVLVQNGEPVEFGQPLFLIRPG